MASTTRDNVEYWINRHRMHEDKMTAVGDIRKSEEENLVLYAKKKKKAVDLLRALSMLDLRGRKVLDAGCGTGLISEVFYVLGGSVSGIDGSEVAVEKAALRAPEGTFKQDSIVDFALEEKFDLIFCADVLYHVVDDENWRRAVINLTKHLEQSGTMILIDQVRDQEQCPAEHVHYRTRRMYEEVVNGQDVKISTFDEHPSVLIFQWSCTQDVEQVIDR